MDIQLCKKCKGSGIIEEFDSRNSFHNTCPNCKGTGKIWESNYTFFINVPYSNDSQIINELRKFDSDMWEFYRKRLKEFEINTQ